MSINRHSKSSLRTVVSRVTKPIQVGALAVAALPLAVVFIVTQTFSNSYNDWGWDPN